jgi:hypothetical protein
MAGCVRCTTSAVIAPDRSPPATGEARSACAASITAGPTVSTDSCVARRTWSRPRVSTPATSACRRRGSPAWRARVLALDAAVPPLEALLAGIAARLASRSLAAWRFHRRVGYEIACNWKVYVDNYLEGYHVPHIHPELNRMLDYRSYRTETARWHSLQHSPLDSGDELYGRGEALYYFVWPNTMLNILPDRLQTNRVVPLGTDRCRVEFDYFYPRTPRGWPSAMPATTSSATSCSGRMSRSASACSADWPPAPTRRAGSIHYGKAACTTSMSFCERPTASTDSWCRGEDLNLHGVAPTGT